MRIEMGLGKKIEFSFEHIAFELSVGYSGD